MTWGDKKRAEDTLSVSSASLLLIGVVLRRRLLSKEVQNVVPGTGGRLGDTNADAAVTLAE